MTHTLPLHPLTALLHAAVSSFLLARGASAAICGMAAQDLDRAAPPLRQRLGGSGDTPGTAYNRILIDFVDITLRMQQFGRDSIGPNHEMYEYSRGILERSTGRLVDIAFSSTQAFGFSVDGVVPPDDVASFHAMDVLQHFELVPEAAAITRNLKKIVEFLCERKCLFCLDSDSLRESCGVYVRVRGRDRCLS